MLGYRSYHSGSAGEAIDRSTWKAFSEKSECPAGPEPVDRPESVFTTTMRSAGPRGPKSRWGHFRGFGEALYARSCK
jgi:hypothetical protein